MIQSGKQLSMQGEAIWKGTYQDNGMMLKINERAYTIGYSNLLTPDGEAGGVVQFGDGVFYDAAAKDNQVYAGIPTKEGAVPKFAGIVVREPGIASGYPAMNNTIAPFQKGLICREGYIIYKNAFTAASADERVNVMDDDGVQYGTTVCVKNTDGTIYFGAPTGDYTQIGSVVAVNPDDKSVTIELNPLVYLG